MAPMGAGARFWRLLFLVVVLVAILVASLDLAPAPPTSTIDPYVPKQCSGAPTSACGARVSKCLLLKMCNCAMHPSDLLTRGCECCAECIRCLGMYLFECCACVGLCELAPPSSAEETSDSEVEMKWEGIQLDASLAGNAFEEHFAPKADSGWQMEQFSMKGAVGQQQRRIRNEIHEDILSDLGDANCTVIYMDECMTRGDCQKRCEVLGASSLRWFHSGCCECAGSGCLPYGSDTARCSKCRNEDFPRLGEEYLDDEL